jgi:hypothetical protein
LNGRSNTKEPTANCRNCSVSAVKLFCSQVVPWFSKMLRLPWRTAVAMGTWVQAEIWTGSSDRFRETGYDEARQQLEINGSQLRSRVNGKD